MDFESILEYFLIVGGVLFLLSRTLEWRSFKRKHPALQYAPDDSIEGWRWTAPPPELAMQKLDTTEYSRLLLPVKPAPEQKFALAFGGFLITMAIWTLFSAVAARADDTAVAGKLFSVVMMALFGYGMLHYESRLIAIDLHIDRVVFVLRYGVYFTRNITIKLSSMRGANGQLQSALGQNYDQKKPYYFLTVKSSLLSRKFITVLNPSQGSWVVGGLQHWQTAYRRP